MTQTKCHEHPKYKAIFAPRATKKHPQGCTLCWAIYETKIADSAERDDEVVGS